MNDPKLEFSKLQKIFMVFHDDYLDVISDCDPKAFDLLYTMHHNTENFEALKLLFFELWNEFGEILKTCSLILHDDLSKIIDILSPS